MAELIKTLFIFILVSTLYGCGGTTTKSIDPTACSAISKDEISSVQGETVLDESSSEHFAGPLRSSQCFYRLATFNKSINLEVTRPAGRGDTSTAIDEFWQLRFGKKADQDNEENAEINQVSPVANREREEEEHRSRPEPVNGIGDESYWVGNQLNGSLYVRRDDVVVRLSLGGPEDQAVKIKKATTLAQIALGRL
jgi:hypothetical protein